MIPPILRPSSMPALAKCPRYSPDQSTGEEQKSEGTKRHTALARYLADDPDWFHEIGTEWDRDGVEWAGEYVRAHAPMEDHPVRIEEGGVALVETDPLDPWTPITGTPDITCGPAVLFDLKGRNIDSYAEQMDAYALMLPAKTVEVHVLYATERKAVTSLIHREEAHERLAAIVRNVQDPQALPRVCDFCGWCANRNVCPSYNATGKTAAQNLGLPVPSGVIEEVRDAAGLAMLLRAADAVAEWAKTAKAHVKDMAINQGVIADGYRLAQRKGHPSISDAWAAIQAAGLPVESVASILSLSLPDLAKAYASHHGLKEKAARTDLETRLGSLVERGSTVQYLTPL